MCIRNNMDLAFINAYTNFYQYSSICSEDIEEKHILHQSRAITLLFINKFSSFAIPNNSSLISMSMQSLKKIGQKLFKLESGNNIFTSIKGYNSVVYNKFSPFAIPNHSSLISMSMQSLKKICKKKLLKLESGKEALTDGRTF